MQKQPHAWYLGIPAVAALMPLVLSAAGMTPWTQTSAIIASAVQAALVLVTIRALHIRQIPRENPWWIVAGAVAIAASTDVLFQGVNLMRGYTVEPRHLYLIPHTLLLYFGYRVLRERGPAGGLLHATDVAIGTFAFALLAGIGVKSGSVHDQAAATSLLWETAILDLPAVLISVSLWYGPNRGHAPRLAAIVLGAIPTRTLAHCYDLAGSTEVASFFGWMWLYAYVIVALAALRGVAVHGSRREVPAQDFSLARIYSSAACAVLPSLALIGSALNGGDVPGRWISTVGIAIALLVAARIAYLLDQTDKQQAKWRYLAGHDGLTGAASRSAWNDALAVVQEREHGNVSRWLAILDFDNFKHHNDTYGHQASDVLLRRSVARWHTLLAKDDVLARYGGEEFTVLLHAHNEHDALARVESLRCAIPGKQTCSAGLAPWWPNFSSDEAMHNADVALYEAKAAGKNRTVISRSKAVRPLPEHHGKKRTPMQRSVAASKPAQVSDG